MLVIYALTLLTGVVECLFYSGIIFGWASLVFVLVQDGYFCVPLSELDEESSSTVNISLGISLTSSPILRNRTSYNISSDTFSTANPATAVVSNAMSFSSVEPIDCKKYQSSQLNMVFTIGSMLLSFSTFMNGYIFDTYGSWAARCFGIILFTAGTILSATSSPEFPWLLYPAMSCVAIGGIILLITNLQIGNLFGRYRSSIITLMSGSLDSSSFVFLIFKTLHASGISLSKIFQVMSWSTILLWVRTFTLLPRKTIPFPIPSNYEYGISDCKTSKKKEIRQTEMMNIDGHQNEEKEALTEGNGSVVNKDVLSMMSCVHTSLFWGNAAHFSFLQLRNYFYLGMLNEYLRGLAGNNDDVLSSYLNVFGTCQLFGVLCAPLNGLLVDNVTKFLSKRSSNDETVPLKAVMCSAIATTFLGTVFSFVVAIPNLPLQYAAFVLQVVFRSFLYGGNMSFNAVAFPPQHFGKLYGLTMTLGGFILILQFPLIHLVLDVLNSEFLGVNIMFLIMSILTILHPLNIYRICRKMIISK